MVEVRNNGVPLIEQAPKAAVTQAIVHLAEALSGSAMGESGSSTDTGRSSITRLLSFWPKSKPQATK